MERNARLIIDNSLVNSDLLYKTGFIAPDPFIYTEIKGKESIIVSILEYQRAKDQVKDGISVYLINEFVEGEKLKDHKSVLAGIIKKFNISSLEVPGSFHVKYADFLRSLNLKLNVIDGYFFPEREVKSLAEINLISDACRIVEKAMKRAETIISESTVNNNYTLEWNNTILTSETLRKEINLEIVKNNAIGTDTIAASGIQSSQPHNVGNGPIKCNVPIVIDIFPRVNNTGYWGDMTRTFVKGKASKVVKNAYKAVKEAKSVVKRTMKEGIISADLQRLAVEVLKEYGFDTGIKDSIHYGFIHSLGHGVGLDIHEKPLIGVTNTNPLKKNNTVTVEPGLYYPEWGGVRLEDLVLVTEDGIKCLNNYEESLEID